MHSFFLSFPIHIFCQKQQSPTAGFPPADIPVNCNPQPELLCGCTKDSSDIQAWNNYWNTNLSPQNPTVLWICMKISLDANQSITLGSEEGKGTEPNSSVYTDIAFSALSGWHSTPDIPFLNTSLPWMLFLLKKTVHTMEGFGFTFNVWPSKSHREAEKIQDQKNKMWYTQSHLGYRSELSCLKYHKTKFTANCTFNPSLQVNCKANSTELLYAFSCFWFLKATLFNVLLSVYHSIYPCPMRNITSWIGNWQDYYRIQNQWYYNRSTTQKYKLKLRGVNLQISNRWSDLRVQLAQERWSELANPQKVSGGRKWKSGFLLARPTFLHFSRGLQVSGQTAVLNHVKYLFKINWNDNGTVILQLSKSSICFTSPLSVTCWTQLSFHRPVLMPSSAGWKEGAGFLSILNTFIIHYTGLALQHLQRS